MTSNFLNYFKKITLIILLLYLFSSLIAEEIFLTSNTKNVETNKEIYSNNLTDEIEPYCNGVNYSVNELNFSDISEINIEIANSREWYINLIQLFLTESNLIEEKFKKRFDSKVNLIYSNGIECIFNSEVRISGDFKDHIMFSSNSVASLDVKLNEGNILGITRFKLLLNNTRGSDNGKNEVIASVIMRNFGFISPRTAIVQASVNGSEHVSYIFQEKPEKEMIEFHLYREGPIIETNEMYIFEYEDYSNEIFDEARNYFLLGKILNKNWLERSFENYQIGIEALETFNMSIYKSYNPNSQLNYLYLNSDLDYLYSYDILNFALNSSHGITNHNRKFYYDKIESNFIPIYFDGDSGFISNPELKIRNDYLISYEFINAAKRMYENFEFDINKLLEEFKYYGIEVNNFELENWLNILKNNILLISKYEYVTPNVLNFNESFLNAENHNVELMLISGNEYLICSQTLIECSETVSFQDVTEISEVLQSSKIELFGSSVENFLNENTIRFNLINNKNYFLIDEFTKLYFINNPTIKINYENKRIDILLKNSNEKVLFLNGYLDGWEINIDSEVQLSPELRQDENLLTGCMTFYKVDFNDLIIKSQNQQCEDSVNFIRSNGSIKKITISESKSDALDFDFSNILIEDLEIINAGNDCLDLSNGEYYLINIRLKNCNDKGLSIGEKSKAKIENVFIENTLISIAIKDSSESKINSLNSFETNICLALYRKKQEFGPSKIQVINNSCIGKNEDFVQIGSIYEK